LFSSNEAVAFEEIQKILEDIDKILKDMHDFRVNQANRVVVEALDAMKLSKADRDILNKRLLCFSSEHIPLKGKLRQDLAVRALLDSLVSNTSVAHLSRVQHRLEQEDKQQATQQATQLATQLAAPSPAKNAVGTREMAAVLKAQLVEVEGERDAARKELNKCMEVAKRLAQEVEKLQGIEQENKELKAKLEEMTKKYRGVCAFAMKRSEERREAETASAGGAGGGAGGGPGILYNKIRLNKAATGRPDGDSGAEATPAPAAGGGGAGAAGRIGAEAVSTAAATGGGAAAAAAGSVGAEAIPTAAAIGGAATGGAATGGAAAAAAGGGGAGTLAGNVGAEAIPAAAAGGGAAAAAGDGDAGGGGADPDNHSDNTSHASSKVNEVYIIGSSDDSSDDSK